MIIYTHWWLKHRFAHLKIKIKEDDKLKTVWMPTNKPKPSFIQKVLDQV
jgi:hypothetical protein